MGSLDSSRNLQANYAISYLFRLDLILHACKIPVGCDRFGILNFVTKQGHILCEPMKNTMQNSKVYNSKATVENLVSHNKREQKPWIPILLLPCSHEAYKPYFLQYGT